MADIGMKIKSLRTARGLTQEALGDLIGVQKAAVQKYETGAVTNIKPEVILNLCDALDVSPSVLMGWRSDGTSEVPELLDKLTQLFGVDVSAMVDAASRMNALGRHTVMKVVSDYSLIEKYRRRD